MRQSQHEKLQISSATKEDGLHLYLSGPLNEDSSFVLNLDNAPKVHHLHLDEVSSINSTGIRQWLIWVKTQQDSVWNLWGCPAHFINQLNAIDGFVPPSSRVRSFYIPYFSDETSEELKVLIDRDIWEKKRDSLRSPVDKSGNPMEPDIIEDRYFKFTNKF
jgi:hypothetical protein